MSASPGVAELTELMTRSTGLSFAGRRGPWMQAAISRAVAEPAVELSFDDLFDRLCDVVTVQESFFFRERSAIDLIRSEVLPELRARTGAQVTAWSAGCARGEEAYTLAILLTDAGLAARSAVLGTDLSDAAVRAAERAVYGEWSLRGVDDALKARCFTVDRDGWRVRAPFRALVRFQRHNLLDEPPGRAAFDLVLCRNVLMYLTGDAVGQVAQRLADALRPGGWLVIGSADPRLPTIEGLALRPAPHGTAYRRPAAGEPAPPAPADLVPTVRIAGEARQSGTRGMPSGTPPRLPPTRGRPDLDDSDNTARLLSAADRALELGNPGEAERLATRALRLSPSAQAHSLVAQALGDQGQLGPALVQAALALQVSPLEAEPHVVLAALLLARGDVAAACLAARKAVYLDPALPPGHLLLARCFDELGDAVAARRARRNAARLLSEEPA